MFGILAFKMGIIPNLIFTYFCLFFPNLTFEQITFSNEHSTLYWNGCIFRKMRIPQKKDDPCYKCTIDPNSPLIKKSWYPQPMVNCSLACDRSTICTVARYFTGVKGEIEPSPLCYQCENRKDEPINFQLIKIDEICSEKCRECASFNDLSTATECASFCSGRPTFCFPKMMIYGHRICYNSQRWYGCNFNKMDSEVSSNLTNNCGICAKLAKNKKEGQECSYDCGFPTYTNPKNGLTYQCSPVKNLIHGDLFLYEVPQTVLTFLQVSSPEELYPSHIISSGYMNAEIKRFIMKRFNMTQLTYPRKKDIEIINEEE